MKNVPYVIVKFCAEEVDRQGRGPIQVVNMVDAWLYAMRYHASGRRGITTDVIQECGHLTEPTKNDGGWRSCGVRVGEHVAPHQADVPMLMSRFVFNLPKMTPAEAYLEFQQVHPFRDGNGRVGKILFNWLNGTLNAPEMPPRFFNCVNY